MSLGSVILLPIFSALGFTGKTGSPDLGPSHCAVLSIAEDSISLPSSYKAVVHNTGSTGFLNKTDSCNHPLR